MAISPQIGGFIAIVIGVCSGAYLVWSLIVQRGSKRWLQTTGEMLESNVEEDSDGWRPRVRYSYVVQGKRYANERLYFHLSNSSTERAATKHLSPYPVGKTVPVYYNPRHPEDAVLDRRMPFWLPLFWLFFASFMLAIGVKMWRDGAF
jgi:Protein of unknown function (DUF3592)